MWKKEFINLLFNSKDPSQLDANKAKKLKFNNTPSSLFKYRTMDKKGHTLDLISEDKIYLSKPSNFNDPFDCALNITTKSMDNDYIREILSDYDLSILKRFNFTSKELYKLKKSKRFIHDISKLYVKKIYPNYKKNLEKYNGLVNNLENKIMDSHLNLEKIKNHIYLTCFSEINDSILMWSHYTHNHEGICIEYNFKELNFNNPLTRYTFPVIYSDNVLDFGEFLPNSNKEFENIMEKYMDGINPNDISDGLVLPEMSNNRNNMAIFAVALNKSKDWDYEKEWRYILLHKTALNPPKFIDVPKPKAIFLGAKINDINKEKIIEIGKKRNINVYQMKLKLGTYFLESYQLI